MKNYNEINDTINRGTTEVTEVKRPSRELKIKVLEGLTSVPGTKSFKPRQSLFNEFWVLEHLLKEIKTSDE